MKKYGQRLASIALTRLTSEGPVFRLNALPVVLQNMSGNDIKYRDKIFSHGHHMVVYPNGELDYTRPEHHSPDRSWNGHENIGHSESEARIAAKSTGASVTSAAQVTTAINTLQDVNHGLKLTDLKNLGYWPLTKKIKIARISPEINGAELERLCGFQKMHHKKHVLFVTVEKGAPDVFARPIESAGMWYIDGELGHPEHTATNYITKAPVAGPDTLVVAQYPIRNKSHDADKEKPKTKLTLLAKTIHAFTFAKGSGSRIADLGNARWCRKDKLSGFLDRIELYFAKKDEKEFEPHLKDLHRLNCEAALDITQYIRNKTEGLNLITETEFLKRFEEAKAKFLPLEAKSLEDLVTRHEKDLIDLKHVENYSDEVRDKTTKEYAQQLSNFSISEINKGFNNGSKKLFNTKFESAERG